MLTTHLGAKTFLGAIARWMSDIKNQLTDKNVPLLTENCKASETAFNDRSA